MPGDREFSITTAVKKSDPTERIPRHCFCVLGDEEKEKLSL
jgi:hypothetical protein